jgi:hypothetical protein
VRNLFIEYFKSSNEHRQSEYDFCLTNNVKLNYFDNIFVITRDTLPVFSSKITKIFPFGERTNYQNIFDMIEASYPDDINMIANGDIYFDKTISLIDSKMTEEVAIGISRTYPIDDYYFVNGFHKNGRAAVGSNDVWVWKGKCKVNNGNFPIGYYSCDCRIMQCFVEAGYRVYNPAKSIKVWHKHKYRSGKNPPNVPGPYWNGPEDHHSIEDVK